MIYSLWAKLVRQKLLVYPAVCTKANGEEKEMFKHEL